LKLFREQGAEPPQAITSATSEYRSNSDKVGNFINECLTKADANIKASDVYAAYKAWCEQNGFGVENKSNFFDELKGKNMLFQSGTVNGKTEKNVVKGYSLKITSKNDSR